MSLSHAVLQYIQRAAANPTVAGDPTWLKRLEKMAKDAFEGFVALTAPLSPMTWESNVFFQGSVQQTNRVPFRFPRPVEIVGFMPTIVVPAGGAGINPTPDDIRVQIDIDSTTYITSGDGVSTPAGGTVGSFITLSAMSVVTPRLLGFKLTAPAPDIGFTYQWKQAAGTYNNTLISMAMFARYI